MCPVSLTVWFLCKSCKLNFAKVDDYIGHKKENHFTEFQCQNTSCIVFEEKIDGDVDNESGLMEATLTLFKEEDQLVNDSRIETNSDPNISCFNDQNLTWQIADLTAQTSDDCYEDSEPISDILMPDTECESQEENTSVIGSFKPKHNPFVLLKRLTSEEVQGASTAANLELNLNKHLTTHSIPRPFKCNQLNCGKAFKYKHNLGTHMRWHSDLRPFGCQQCDKTFKFRYHLVEHLRRHTGERPYKCPVDNCGKTYAQSKTLHVHKRMVHCNTSSQNKPFHSFGCHQCDKAFKFHCRLVEHLRRHTGERPYKCPLDNCEKSYPTATSLWRHKKTAHRVTF